MKRRAAAFCAIFLLAAAGGCDGAPEAEPDKAALALPKDEPALADLPGKSAFTAVCVACHSSRYVIDQPPLARAAWAKVVDKMKTAYGAPVPVELEDEIVGYLDAVHGEAK